MARQRTMTDRYHPNDDAAIPGGTRYAFLMAHRPEVLASGKTQVNIGPDPNILAEDKATQRLYLLMPRAIGIVGESEGQTEQIDDIVDSQEGRDFSERVVVGRGYVTMVRARTPQGDRRALFRAANGGD